MAETSPVGDLANAGVSAVEEALDQVPLLAWMRGRYNELELTALEHLRDRLGVDDLRALMSTEAADELETPADSAQQAFEALLAEGDDQSPADARAAHHLWVVRSLVPDEARMLRRLADGSEHPVIHAHEGSQAIVSNHTALARNARVRAVELGPVYLRHLLDLGLVELVPYRGGDDYEFELLEAETPVRSVMARYDHRKVVKPRIVRQLVRLSPVGRRFYDACNP